MKKPHLILCLIALSSALWVACIDFGNQRAVGGHTMGDTSGQWVDLGLPSGLLWASCNVGALTPEGCGEYFAWGETSPTDYHYWYTYRFGSYKGTEPIVTKYNTRPYFGNIDGLTTLLDADDAAATRLGSGARIPTRADWMELEQHTTSQWVVENDVEGRRFTASGGRSIFLPAAGSHWGSGLYQRGESGCYWSSSLYTDQPDHAWYFRFDSAYWYVRGHIDRSAGLPVRAVRKR